MNDKIFLKNSDDGMWEKNPHLAYLPWYLGGIILFFCFLISGLLLGNNFLIIVAVLILLLLTVILPTKINNDKNISKSIAFIKRDYKWYAIKLMYNYADAGLPINESNSSTIPHNIEVAKNIQKMEGDIKEERTKEVSYSEVLDEVLQTIEQNNYEKPVYSTVDKILDSFFNGYYFNEIFTIYNRLCGYLILEDLKIERVNKKYFVISFNENNSRITMKFRNVYGGLIEEIMNNK